MKTTKQKRRILSVIVIIIVVAVAFAYILPIAAMAGENGGTPAPNQDEQFGTDLGLDDSTLPTAPSEEEKEEKDPPRLTLPAGPLELEVGREMVVEPTIENFPEGALIEWKTANADVAMISQDGRLKAVSPGNTEVSATAVYEEGKAPLRATVLVTVNEVQATGVAMTLPADIITTAPKTYEVKVGDVVQLVAVVEPAGAKVERFTWALGNAEVASITSSGANCEFVAEAVGSTQLTVAAGSFEYAITIGIAESGISTDAIWTYIKYGIIIVAAIVAIVVVMSVLSQRRKKEQARQRELARRRREGAGRKTSEDAFAAPQYDKAMQEYRPASSSSRETMKISGAGVGARQTMPEDGTDQPERPVTLDDLD